MSEITTPKKPRKLNIVDHSTGDAPPPPASTAVVDAPEWKRLADAQPLKHEKTPDGVVMLKGIVEPGEFLPVEARPAATFEDQLRAQMKLPPKGEERASEARQKGLLAAAPAPAGIVRMVPIGDLVESKTNPRRSFKALEELAASFARVGMLQAILARPHPEAGKERSAGTLEIVAGARRFRAAKLAKLAEVPVDVRPLTDLQVLEAQVVENVQRESFTPLEEAEGYESLVKNGYEVPTIAEKVGKTRGWVYARLRLLHLEPHARSLLLEVDEQGRSRLPLSVAYVLASYGAELQVKGLKLIDPKGEGEIAARWALDQLRNNLCRKLATVPWKLNDEDLVVEAGACTTCPHNSANAPIGLFDEKKPPQARGECMKLECAERKAKAFFARSTAKAQAAGATVLGPKEAKEVMPYGHLSYNAPFVEADAVVFSDAKKRTWRQVLAELPADKRIAETIVPDDHMKPVTLFDRKEATAAAATLGMKWAKAEQASKALATKNRERKKKDAKKNDLEQRTAAVLARQVIEHALERNAPGLPELRALTGLVERVSEIGDENLAELFKIKGSVDEWIEKKASATELIAYCLASLGWQPWVDDVMGGIDDGLIALAKAQGVDPKKVRDAQAAAIEQESLERKNAKKSAKAAKS